MAVKNNKVYVRVLTELGKMYKPGSYGTLYNNLIKCYYDTEDYVLKGLLHEYCNLISEVSSLTSRRLPSHVSDCIQRAEPRRGSLIEYCNNIVQSGKPEWQVIAEKHGWRPPV